MVRALARRESEGQCTIRIPSRLKSAIRGGSIRKGHKHWPDGYRDTLVTVWHVDPEDHPYDKGLRGPRPETPMTETRTTPAVPPADATPRRDERISKLADPEIRALATAYYAITAQPREAWPRMIYWLDGRIASDLENWTNGR